MIRNVLPKSSSSFILNLFSVVLFFIAIQCLLSFFPWFNLVQIVLLALFIASIPLWVNDLLYYKTASVNLLERPRQTDIKRLSVKLVGLFATFIIILIFYKINPIYYSSPNAERFYGMFFSVIGHGAPWILLVSIIYFWYVDSRQKEPFDEYWQAGCLVLGRIKEVQWIVLSEYAKAWFIKAFFTPFMFSLLVDSINALMQWTANGITFIGLYNHLLDLFYAVDIVFGVLGYVLAFRILNTHIQSTEPTLVGWWSCLSCYSPFYALIGIGLLPSQSEKSWDVWFSSNPILFYSCGILILLLSLIYALASVAIGYRLSNLTYRGIITSGPYRFTKHPAYICKVTSWWFVSIPFLSTQGVWGAVAQCLSMIAISVIYYIRAKTEENHLSNYPEYVQYANWINDHGTFAFLGRIIPALRYSEEKAKLSKSVVWFKQLQG